jgi:hypothetical protein
MTKRTLNRFSKRELVSIARHLGLKLGDYARNSKDHYLGMLAGQEPQRVMSAACTLGFIHASEK